MGFLQRGFAYGNKKGFAVWATGTALTFTMKIIGVLLGGGGKIADQTTNILTFGKVVGLGSYPDALARYLGVDLTTFQLFSGGGGGKIADRTETVFTATVELSLGSYP